MKKLCFEMRKLAPDELIHIERVGKFALTKAGDAVVIDIVPKQLLMFIYPLGPAWQARTLVVGEGDVYSFPRLAQSDSSALCWSFEALFETADAIMHKFENIVVDADMTIEEKNGMLMYMLGKRAIYELLAIRAQDWRTPALP